jgi:hypothetical protein
MSPLQVIVLGCIGGIIPDAIRVAKGRYDAMPGYLKAPMFWTGLFILVAIGGFAAWLGGASEVKQALAYGYAGPELLSRLLAAKNTNAVDRGDLSDQRFSLRRAWSL